MSIKEVLSKPLKMLIRLICDIFSHVFEAILGVFYWAGYRVARDILAIVLVLLLIPASILIRNKGEKDIPRTWRFMRKTYSFVIKTVEPAYIPSIKEWKDRNQ